MKVNPSDFTNQKAFLKKLAASMNQDELTAYILSAAEKRGTDIFRKEVAEEIMQVTKPCDVIPEIYSDYRQILRDGILFLLSGFSPDRLAQLAAAQLLMNENTLVEERLISLIKEIPTLHKLGQIIARNRNVSPAFRKWLIQLENDAVGTGFARVRQEIDRETAEIRERFSIIIGDEILARASVGTVVPFTWSSPRTGKTAKGVFKILTPGVTQRLNEELRRLDELALFFHENRGRYPLKEFRFIETFRDVREALEEEIDLRGEQANLRKAAYFYSPETLTQIPRVLRFSTPNMTAMEFMNGLKITDADMDPDERRSCAQTLFKTVIGHPLFSREDRTLFHGDPHAGNIFALKEDGGTRIALLDWSQVGYLSKAQRINMLRLVIGVILDHEEFIREAIENLAHHDPKREIKPIIRDIMTGNEYTEAPLIKRAFLLIDQSSVKGIRFTRDLLLFRKAFFTLEGVLYNLDPGFDMDTYMIRLVGDLFIEELPKRWTYLLFPHSDRPEHYKSLLSNNDLNMLSAYLFMELFKTGANLFSFFMEKNAEILTRAWR